MATKLVIFLLNTVLVIFAKPTDLGIIDGDLSKIEEHPWMVSLFMDHPYDPTFRCNGFLISESWVVTSSGCLLDGIVSARIGSASLYGGEEFDVINVLKHPNFTFLEDYTYLNDIGLIQVSPNVSASLGVPIRLPEANVGVPVGTIINMTGYGSTVDGGGAYYAYTAVLPIISATDCQDYFQYDLIDDTMMLCAGYSDIQRGYCWGDDGAPAELNGVAIGVASWTPNFCATMPFPTVFTNLTSYVDWIKEVTGV